MKISYTWLKNYLDFDYSPEELSVILTDTGLEVEGLESYESIRGGLEGVVIGKVLTCEKHPDADKLSLTTVDIGAGEPVQIVCGAPNVAAGQIVPVATVGATLYPDSKGEGFQIKKAKIRGQASHGMICAEDELGLGKSHDGIMVLDGNAKVGSSASDYFKITRDVVFEIGLTPNRIDGASHIGVARDIAAYLQHNGTIAQLQKPDVSDFAIDDRSLEIPVEVRNPEACPRYSGVTLTGLKVQESPSWLVDRLKAIGQEPINNVVDITNYVLHETGQPLHAFDAEKIKGNRVVVQTMPNNTPFTTLDEKERKLTDQDLMICNASEGMCIGGVFGGVDSGVKESTTEIFLESACFDPVFIRKTAKHHQLNTDASFRFERGTDPNGTLYALKRAALLIKEIAGGKISSDVSDFYPQPVDHFKVEVTFESMARLIGKTIEPKVIKNILRSLDIEVRRESEKGLSLLVPPYRVDVQREADIVEEILRIYGFNNVEMGDQVRSTLSYVEKPDREKIVNVLSDLLCGMGFNEIKSNSLTREDYFEEDDPSVVKIHNPLSQDLSRLRKDLIHGGLEAVIYNINRKNGDLRLFEFGNCYWHDPHKKEENPRDRFGESFRLGLFISGNFTSGNWNTQEEESSFFHLRSIAENLMGKLGIQWSELTLTESKDHLFDQKITLTKGEKVICDLGSIKGELLNSFGIKQAVYAAEFNWDNVIKVHKRHKLTFEPLPKFMEVKRDLSLMLDQKVTFQELKELAFKAEKRLLQRVDLFDVYEGDKIEKGKKSYALSFYLLDQEKSLTDKLIDKTINRISSMYERELGAAVRGA